MGWGIAGAHRTGKSSLAEAVSQETDLPLVLTSVSNIYRELGLHPAKPMTFEERMRAQNAILDRLSRQWSEEIGGFVTDRTPIDLIAYTLSDFGPTADLSMAQWKEVESYIDQCYAVGNRLFEHYVLLQPGIPLVADPDKVTAALCPGYQELLNSVMMGVMIDKRNTVPSISINRGCLDHNIRLSLVLSTIDKDLDGWVKESQASVKH